MKEGRGKREKWGGDVDWERDERRGLGWRSR